MDMQEMQTRIQEAKDAISDLEAALENSTESKASADQRGDYQEARDWAQQLEGAALDIIEAIEGWID